MKKSKTIEKFIENQIPNGNDGIKIEAFRPDIHLKYILDFLNLKENLEKINKLMIMENTMFIPFKNKSELYRYLIKFALNNNKVFKEFIEVGVKQGLNTG